MRFDLNSYATVAERLAQFHQDYPDGRIVTEWENNNRFEVDADTKPAKTWVVKATIYLSAGDQANGLAKSTGYASETDGTGGANNVAALPNAESSAVGRALMLMGYSMNKDPKTLASREEMQKVERATRDYLSEARKLKDVEQLRLLWAEAKAARADEKVLAQIKELANAVSSTASVDGGTKGSV
jgi:hypothetical protein